MFATDQSIGVVELARSEGFASFYVPEHTHIPSSRATPAPAGEPLGEEYSHSLDPFVSLTAAAAVTEGLVVGTGIALVAQRDPIVMAKQVASLDLVSGGRFVLGIGFVEPGGDGPRVTYAERRKVAREHVLAMKALWSDEEASFSGQYVSFEPTWSWPKPVQRPHPPILVGGGGGPKLFEAIADYADGWILIGGGGVRAALPELRAAFERAGRTTPMTSRWCPSACTRSRGSSTTTERSGSTRSCSGCRRPRPTSCSPCSTGMRVCSAAVSRAGPSRSRVAAR